MKNYHQEVASVSKGITNFFHSTFANIHLNGPALDAEQIQKSPLMIVSTHRSHVDYFFVGNTLFNMGFKNLRFAAGDNLTKLPWIGPRFKAFGAFTVSRDGGFERNYVRNLCAEVTKMLENRDAVLVFPEGGRSYTGAMLDVKGGILNAALLSQASSPDQDVFLIPVAVSYDCPPDVPFFPLLLKGKKLRKKGNSFFKQLLGNIYYFGADILAFGPFFFARHFRKKYGEIHMDYLAPISVKSLVDLEANRVQGARDEFSAHRVSLEKISEIIQSLFISLYRVLPVHLVSAALRDDANCSLESVRNAMGPLIEKATRNKQNLTLINELSPDQIVDRGLKQLQKTKAIKIQQNNIKIVKEQIVDYFASSLISTGEQN